MLALHYTTYAEFVLSRLAAVREQLYGFESEW